MAEAGVDYKVEARVAGRIEVVKTDGDIPTVKEIRRQLDTNDKQALIHGRVADPLTFLVPDAVVEFC